MKLMTHRRVSLHRHNKASFASSASTATIVSIVYCALLPFTSTTMAYPEMAPLVLAKAFAYSWTSTFIFGLGLSFVIFSILRVILSRLGANLGVIYVATGAILVAELLALGATGKDSFADNVGIWLGAGIGAAYGIFYWLVAPHSRKQPVHPQHFATMTAETSANL